MFGAGVVGLGVGFAAGVAAFPIGGDADTPAALNAGAASLAMVSVRGAAMTIGDPMQKYASRVGSAARAILGFDANDNRFR